MKKALFITATPTVGGNGDTLLEVAAAEATGHGAEVHTINVREKNINYCKACYGCAKTGVCVQKDDFTEILALIHEADAVIAEAPIYYNCMAAQMLTVINRLCCTFACKTYKLGEKKRVGIMLTCTGSEVDEMKRHVRNITTLPSISRAISEERIEVFTNCNTKTTCKNMDQYLQMARDIGAWAVQ